MQRTGPFPSRAQRREGGEMREDKGERGEREGGEMREDKGERGETIRERGGRWSPHEDGTSGQEQHE